jgi:hypothetical protein
MREVAKLDRLAESVRALDRDGASDEEVAVWLKKRTADFGESARVLRLARGLSARDAHAVLRATELWRATARSYDIVFVPGTEVAATLISVNGRMHGVGDVLLLPGGPCTVLAVGPNERPGLTATLVVERGRPVG